MEDTIKKAVEMIKTALDRLEAKALTDLQQELASLDKLNVCWQYAEPLLKISQVLEQAGMI